MTHVESRERMRLALSGIERDVRVSELTDDEIASLAATLSRPTEVSDRTSVSRKPVEVTQADREAAADYEEHFPPHMGGQVFRDGVADDHPLVQAFAKHRLASRTPPVSDRDGEVERVVSALHPAWFATDYNHRQAQRAVRAALAALPHPEREERLKEALEKCRDRFREYEAHHTAKAKQPVLSEMTRVEFVVKAERNQEMAEMCESALASLRKGGEG